MIAPDMMLCPNCEGSGATDEEFGTVWACPQCGGTGWREPDDENLPQ